MVSLVRALASPSKTGSQRSRGDDADGASSGKKRRRDAHSQGDLETQHMVGLVGYADDDGARPSSKIGSQDDLDAKAASRGNAARARKTPKKKTPSSSSSSPRSRRPGASADGGDGAPSKATTARNKRRDRAKKTRTTTAGGEGPGPGGVGDANASGRGKLLTADEEKQLGGAIQQLLRIEAMENELDMYKLQVEEFRDDIRGLADEFAGEKQKYFAEKARAIDAQVGGTLPGTAPEEAEVKSRQ